jgi:protein TonB
MAFVAQSPFSGPRLAVIIGIVLLHYGVYWALENGLAQAAMQIITGPLDVKMIEEEISEPEEPPPPPPKLEVPPPFVPPPDFAIELPVEATTAIQTTTSVVPPPAPPPMAPAPVTKSPPRSPTKGLSQPEYPPAARRLGQEGTVTLLIYVLADGRVGEVKVEKSSGFPKLDEAAATHAKRSWRFIPGQEGNSPIASWGRFAVTFKLIED